jgi:hypothetical protein
LGQLGDAFNVTSFPISIPTVQVKLHQASSILIFLAAILATVAFIGKRRLVVVRHPRWVNERKKTLSNMRISCTAGGAIQHWQRNNLPRAIAAGTALASLIATCLGIALTVYSYWTALAVAQQSLKDLYFKWGPAIGTLSAAGACLIVALIGYIASCFNRRDRKRDSYQLYDYDFGRGKNHYY